MKENMSGDLQFKSREKRGAEFQILPVACGFIESLRLQTVEEALRLVRLSAPRHTRINIGQRWAYIAFDCAPGNFRGHKYLHVCAICDSQTIIEKGVWTNLGLSVIRLRKHNAVALLYCNNDDCRTEAQRLTHAAFERLK